MGPDTVENFQGGVRGLTQVCLSVGLLDMLCVLFEIMLTVIVK